MGGCGDAFTINGDGGGTAEAPESSTGSDSSDGTAGDGMPLAANADGLAKPPGL